MYVYLRASGLNPVSGYEQYLVLTTCYLGKSSDLVLEYQSKSNDQATENLRILTRYWGTQIRVAAGYWGAQVRVVTGYQGTQIARLAEFRQI